MGHRAKHFGSLLLYSITFWLIASGLYLLIRFYGTSESIDWASGAAAFLGIWLTAGGVLGAGDALIVYHSERPAIRRKPYWMAISVRVTVTVAGVVAIIFITRLAAAASGSIPPSQIVSSFFTRLADPVVHPALLFVATASLILSFQRQMRNMVGGRVLRDLLLGRYHHPKEENRIFMFLDLKGSTTHAERLGHLKFSRLIQDCFHDLTDSAIRYEVEIYNYVGDEAILTWTIPDGVRNANCIALYFHFKQTLESRASYYQKTYGLLPEFKAGVNNGLVTVAEVGDIKRHIAYLSDVLNTAARIQGECNAHHRELLVSASIAKLLESSAADSFAFSPIGDLALKGRDEKVPVLAVDYRGGRLHERHRGQR